MIWENQYASYNDVLEEWCPVTAQRLMRFLAEQPCPVPYTVVSRHDGEVDIRITLMPGSNGADSDWLAWLTTLKGAIKQLSSSGYAGIYYRENGTVQVYLREAVCYPD